MLYVNPTASNWTYHGADATTPAAHDEAAYGEFEQVFVFKLLQEMRKSVPEGGLFPRSQQQTYFEEVLDDHLAGAVAESGQFGIGEAMRREVEAANQAKRALGRAHQLALDPANTGLSLHPGHPAVALHAASQGLTLTPSSKSIPLPPARGEAMLKLQPTSRISMPPPITDPDAKADRPAPGGDAP